MTDIRTVVLIVVGLGAVRALDCIECEWTVQNDTVDHDCLGAPYKTDTVTCPDGQSPGERYMCQTHGKFDVSGGVMILQQLERKCGLKHSECNNACSDKTSECWSCCEDNDNCNGFPLRANVMITSGATMRTWIINQLVAMVTAWFVYNVV